MSVDALLARLAAAGVRLAVAGDRLRYDAPAGTVDAALLAELKVHKAALVARLAGAPAAERRPLAPPQASLWFLASLYPDDTSAAEQFVVELDGPLDAARLAAAWAAVVTAHPILRVRFGGPAESPWQAVADAAPDYREVALAGPDADAALAALATAELARPFDLASGQPVRAVLARRGPARHALVVTAHHLVADGLSVVPLRGALLRAYAGAGLATDTTYLDWAASGAAGAGCADAAAVARVAAALAPAATTGLGGLPRPAPAPPRQSERRSVVVPPAVAAAAAALARRWRTTPFVVVLAAFRALLARYAGADDLLLGTPLTLRDGPEAARAVGCFVNPAALRTPLQTGDSFADLVGRERATVLAAVEARQLPFAAVVAAAGGPRRLGEHPLFQVLVSLEAGFDDAVAAGLRVGLATLPVPRASYFDLELALRVADDGGWRGSLAFATDRVEAVVADGLARHLPAFLAAALAAPDQPLADLDWLPPAERAALLPPPPVRAARPTVIARFLAQAAATPAAPAVRAGTTRLDYATLAARSTALAAALRDRGIAPGTPVAVALPRSAELVVALLAVLQAGAVLLPLDPGYPPARRRFILRDAGAVLLLADAAGCAGLDADAVPVLSPADWPLTPTATPPALPDPAAPACLLYTSGSTGEPKGAVQRHRGFAARVAWLAAAHGVTPADVFSLRSSPNFIDCYWEVFGALAHGAELVVVPDAVAADPEQLPGFIHAAGVTQLVLVPALLQALVADRARAAALAGLRILVTSGEPLPPALARRVRALLPATLLLNTYGTSEIWDAAAEVVDDVPAGAARVPVGRPLPYARCYVLDAAGQPQPVGVPGELWVGGEGVGPGYWRRPALTAERFRPLPWTAAAPCYRTGDAARWLPDGRLELLGRLDAQQKLRGQRFEPGEVEALLLAQPAVAAAGVALAGDGEAARVVAGIVPRTPGPLPVAELRAALRAALPAFMVPADWAALPVLPQTPSGKLDRRALAAAVLAAGAADGAADAPPRPGTEAAVAALWAELLERGTVARDADFFALGGHSLLASRLVARCRAQFGVAVALADLFRAPTVAALAASIDARRAAAPAGADAPAAVPVRAPGGPLPLAPAQQRLWFLATLDADSTAQHVPVVLRLTGALDVAALQAALLAVVDTHELLRARVPAAGGQPVLVIDPAPARVLGAVVDLAPGADAASVLAGLAAAPFDLAAGPLFRATLLRVAADDHRLLLVAHHLVTDATSNHVLFADLAAAYAVAAEGGAPRVAPPALAYPEYAAAAATRAPPAADLAFWQQALAGAPAVTTLPADFPRPAEQRFRGAWRQCVLPPALVAAVRATARARRTTPFVVLLAGFAALVRRWSGQDDLVIGTPVEGRLEPGLERTVGLFINSLALRVAAGGEPDFATFLGRVDGVVRAAQAHQALPFEELVRHVPPRRSLAHAPVFQLLFNFVRLPERERVAGPVRFRQDALLDLGVAAFDLTLTAAEDAAGIALTAEYATDLYAAGTIDALLAQYRVLLAAALAAPATPIGRLPLLDAAGRAALAAQLAPPAPALPLPEPVTVTVARLAAARPTAPALRAAGGDGVVSYGELEAAATALARRLVAGGAGPGLRIGIALPRGPDYLVAVLAVLKAGAAYVPLDPDYPPARLAYLVADAGLTTVIGAASLGAVGAGLADPTVAAPAAAASALPPPDPDGVAYVLYTSGSTGEPKGVVVGHAGLARIAAAWRDTYALRPGQVHLQMASAAFDVFTGDWVRALTSGGCVVFCPRDVLLDPPVLLALLVEARVDVAEFVPAVVRGLLAELEARAVPLPPLDLLIVGSDAWYGSEYARLRACAAPGTRVVNSYGLAEATIDSSWYEAPEGRLPAATEPVPIGRPFAGTRLYICDDAGEPLPPGVPGELWIAGDGVARGYLGRPAETAARFRPDPLVPGARACRSGDRARLAADGHLVLLGRTDAQLKVRGIRVEPGEVEAALAADPRVAAAAVALRPGAGEEPVLAGYYVPRDAAVPPDPAALEAGLRARLPAALVPAVLVALPALPLTANGKLDRAALPAAPLPPPAGDRPATTPTEAAVAAVAAELLGVPALAPDDDFFRRGGHSLLAARLVARLRARFGVELPLRAVFAAPTMAGLAAAVAAAQTTPPGPPLRPRAGGGALPLSLPQQRLWFLHRLNPASSAWHISWAVELTGALARAALQAAVAAVVARHAALRTVFAGGDGDAEPVQRVQAELDVPVEWLAMPGLDAEGERALLAALARRPFDLGTGPLLRVTVLATAPARQVLVLVVHHIVADGWSLAVLAEELSAAYAAALAGRAPDFAPLPVQYGDWALWQREWLAGGELDRQLQYWREALAGAPPFLDLGGGQPRPPVPTGRGDWLVRRLPAAATAGVDALALATGCTPYMVLLGLFGVVLGRYGGTADVVVGTPVAGRPRPELEGLVGFFVNTLALRVSLAGDPTVGALLARVRDTVLAGLAHADLPFEKLVEALNPPRTLARPPVVQVLFVYHNQPPARLALPGLAATPALAAADAVKLDLTLHVAREGGELVAAFGWDTDVLPAVRVARLAADFVALVEASVAAGAAAPLPAQAAPPAPRSVAVPAVAAGADPAGGAADPAVLAGLRVLWCELLGRATVADDDDFFALGGHSLLALRLLARIAARFGVELPPATVFARPTLRGLAAAIGPAATPPPAPIPRQPRRGG